MLNKPGLDYEDGGTESVHVLDIRVEDKSGASSTGKVTVRVKDVNEAPVVVPPSPFSLTENSPAGTLVGAKMKASDVDAGHSRLLSWSITQGNVGDAFHIDEITGQVSVFNGKSLNYETMPINGDGEHTPFLLEVTARDVGLLPTQEPTEFPEAVLPIAVKPMGCKNGAILADAKWINLEGNSAYTSLLTVPASKIIAASSTKHAYVWTTKDCKHEDKVDGSKNGQSSGAPVCDIEGLKLNSGELSDPGIPGQYSRKLQIGESKFCSSDSECMSGSCDVNGIFGCSISNKNVSTFKTLD